MFVYIDKTIGLYCKENDFNKKELNLFAALADSHRRGKCIVSGEIGTLDMLQNKLNSPYCDIYKTMLSEYSEIGSLIECIDLAIVISFEKDISVSNLPRNLKRKARVLSVKEAMEIDWEIGCEFVAENLSDITFYISIGKYYSFNKGASSCGKKYDISFHKENGGGGTIGATLRKCIREDKALTLCIVDSDKKYGKIKGNESPYGSTYVAVNAVAKEEKKYDYLFFLYVVPAHEIENLIPMALMNDLDFSKCNVDGIDIVKKLSKIQDDSPVLYYDFKKGIISSKDESYNNYWEAVQRNPQIMSIKLNCGISDNILEYANNALSKMNIRNLKLGDYLEDIWNEIGKIVFTWGCVSSKQRI